MEWQELVFLIFIIILLASLIGIYIYTFFKFGYKQIEVDYKCRKAHLKFYEIATMHLENQLNVEKEKRGDK